MKRTLLAMAAAAGRTGVGGQARADTVVGITLSGGGISGNIVISYGAATDSSYPGQGFEITGIAGTFTDAALGIVGATITSLVPISPTRSTLNPDFVTPSHDFSHFGSERRAVASGCRSE